MISSRARAIGSLLAFAVVVAGCTSTTDGAGESPSSVAASSTPDFPSGGPATPSDVEPSAPIESLSASDSGAAHPAPATPLKTVTVHAADNRTYVVKIWAHVTDKTCFDHAYGQQMIAFLIKHPCRGLERYLGTTTVNGNVAGFAESVTSFAGTTSNPYVNSNDFIRLENADGTGSLSDLLREGYRLPAGPPSVPASEAFNVLSQDNGVTVWDAWYLSDTTPSNDPALVQMTKDIFLQF